MRAAVNALALWSAAAALQITLPGAALAQDEGAGGVAQNAAPAPGDTSERNTARKGSGQAGADLWVPSLSVIAGVSIQNWSGSVMSEICEGCNFPDPSMMPLRESVSGKDRDVTPYVGGSLELMTPELSIPTSPRFFVGGEIAATFGFERNLASEGEPGELRTPAPEGSEGVPYEEDAALGQGSATIAQLRSPFYGAYLGVAFPFEIYGRQLRIKPNFAWMRYDITLSGEVVDAECAPTGVGDVTNCNTAANPPGFMRQIRLLDQETSTFDAIGPGFDIELDTGQLGPVGTSLFGGGRFYYTLGNRSISLSAGASYDDAAGGPDQAAAEWDFEVEPWVYRIVLGMRFQWLGFQK